MRRGPFCGTPIKTDLYGKSADSRVFILRRISVYLERFLNRYSSLDSQLIEALHWLLDSEMVEMLVEDLAPHLRGQAGQSCWEQMVENLAVGYLFAGVLDDYLKTARREVGEKTVEIVAELLTLRIFELHSKGKSDVESNLSLFRKMFGLNELESEICLFLLIARYFQEAEDLFIVHLKCNDFAGRSHLATFLDTSEADIRTAWNGKLTQIGIIDPNYGTLTPAFNRLLQDGAEGKLKTEFFTRVSPSPISLEAHEIDTDLTQYALDLFREKPETPAHILLYGPPGTGKTSYAYGLGSELGLPIYKVEHGGKANSVARLAALTACINMTSEGEGAIIVADDAESILDTRRSWPFFSENADRTWLHDLLETPGVRMVWTVNSIAALEESVARRFALSIRFNNFSRRQRTRLWGSILEKHGLHHIFEPFQVEDLAARFDCSPGMVEQAVSKAVQTDRVSRERLYSTLTLSLDAHETLINGGLTKTRRTPEFEDFSLDGLNVKGTNLESFLEDLEAFDKRLKLSGKREGLGIGLLFFGPSGTGKSHLARYIAHRLDREAMCTRGSDLLSPFIGETEQAIRQAYQEAEAKGAVLVFDEAESLIFSREKAHHRWELGFTNEFLNCMEQFSGIQVFTTNRHSDLDLATLRRLTYKIEFKYLTPGAKEAFFKTMLASLTESEPHVSLLKRIKAVPSLTPGDFKTVRDKFILRERRKVSPEDLVAALEEESRVKTEHEGRRKIGFMK